MLAEPVVAAFEPQLGRETVKAAVGECSTPREAPTGNAPTPISSLGGRALEGLRLQALVPVVNATGIIVHTNLGRAPLAANAGCRSPRSRGYANLEYDLAEGERGSRYERAAGALRELTGAQDALVVNNCAAAVLLVLDTFAKGREVVSHAANWSRSAAASACPRCWNAAALRSSKSARPTASTSRTSNGPSPRGPALFLRTHPSNYRIEGFTHEAAARELAELAQALRRAGRRGSRPRRALRSRAVRTAARAHGVRCACGWSDARHLLRRQTAGRPAGWYRRRAGGAAIARLRGNPLLRALRVDKMTLAALSATLELHAAPRRRAREFRSTR